jgi:MoxR-like ATPase
MQKLRNRLDRPVVLVGLMGAGKSTVGRRLAKRLELPFVDSDTEIEDAAGYSAAELFESAVVMGKAALSASGVARSEVERVEREYRLRDCERLERQAASGDLHAGADRSFASGPLPDESGEPPAPPEPSPT